jgi:hypothetical protein
MNKFVPGLFALVIVLYSFTAFASASEETNIGSIRADISDGQTVTTTIDGDALSKIPSTLVDDFESYNIGDIREGGEWSVTNYYGNVDNHANISTDLKESIKYAELASEDAIVTARHIASADKGVLEFKMRHNKSGLFYFNALTSDAGGQLLFSIQFTESKGILLEQSDTQIALLPDYISNQWYSFTIDFDNTRGERGTLKIKIDDGKQEEYPYVSSESVIFDLSQIVFASENNGGRAVSAFVFDGAPEEPTVATEEIPTENSTTTSITADLNNAEISTLNIDGTAVSENSSATDTNALSQTASASEADSGLLDTVVDTLLDVVGADPPAEEQPAPTPVSEVAPNEDNPASESVTGDVNNDATITTTF